MKEEEEHLEIFVVYYKWSYFFFNCEQNLYYILLFFLFCVRKSMWNETIFVVFSLNILTWNVIASSAVSSTFYPK